MFTLTIYGYFLVWLLVLFFPLGGLQDWSELVWLMLLSSTLISGFGVVGASLWVLYI